MAKVWKKWDLGGGGLQSANIALARQRKRRVTAYALWPLFVTGAHAFYLDARLHAAAYLVATGFAVAAAVLGHGQAALILLTLMGLFALYDLIWIDQRIIALNKALRIAVSLQNSPGAPARFTGRYEDPDLDSYVKQKEQERGGHAPGAGKTPETPSGRAASFAEQEALLRALAQKGDKTRKK